MEFQEHKRLIELLPDFLQQYREYQVIMDAEQEELDGIHQRISDLLSDAFTDTATEEGIARREQMYHMTPEQGASLEERRLAVKAQESGSLPYTIRQYRNMLAAICGGGKYQVDLDPEAYTLYVKLDVEQAGKNEYALLAAVRRMSRKVIPANLVYDSALRIPMAHQMYTGAGLSRRKRITLQEA